MHHYFDYNRKLRLFHVIPPGLDTPYSPVPHFLHNTKNLLHKCFIAALWIAALLLRAQAAKKPPELEDLTQGGRPINKIKMGPTYESVLLGSEPLSQVSHGMAIRAKD